MADTLTPNLKLRVNDDLTADAKYNLNRIDGLGSATKVENNGNLRIRSVRDIIFTPESQDLGGDGTGGTVSVGEAGINVSTFEIFADLVDFNDSPALIREIRFPELALNGVNYVGFAPPDLIADNVIWTLPSADGLINQVLITDGAGNLGWATVLTDSLAENNVNIGNSSDMSDPTDTSALGDILADSVTGLTIKAGVIVDADINSVAAISFSKMEALTADKAVITGPDGEIGTSSASSAEVAFLAGVTSSIQTQIDGKEPTISVLPISKGGTNSSTALNNNRIMTSLLGAIKEAPAIAASKALASDLNGLPVAATTSAAELDFLAGTTSSVQTQLNNKQPLDSTLTALAAYNTNGILTQVAVDTFVGRTLTAGAGISISDGDGVAGNPSIASTITQYTDELAQDAVGTILLDTNSIDLSYNDGTPTISADLKLSAALADSGFFNTVASIETDGLQVQVQKSDVQAVIDSGSFAANWITADGTSKSITHNLNSRDVMIQVYDAATFETIYTDTAIRTTLNAVDLTATQAPASTWRVLIRKV